jgi:cellulose synthase/poly-beta-1,6-N-acetylglucosamine synthase-like glycosyltransferase
MYRFFEILPGALAWLTLILMVVLSWKLPTAVAIFIILFDVYWLLKTVYLSFHLRSTFSEMKKNLKINWLEKLKALPLSHNPNNSNNILRSRAAKFEEPTPVVSWRDIYHLVIFPMYKEPYEVVRESFESIVKANYPKDKFIVVLATEERAAPEAQITAKKIKEEFGSEFFKFLVTLHPKNLPGEIPGKGSNETWAAKEVKRLIIDSLRIPYENILVSVFDIDTQVPPEYFGRLTYVFLKTENRLRAIYQPIPLYTNNIYRASIFSRIVSYSNTFWHMMQQARPERLRSYSSQSLPFQAVADVGFWDTDIVSEDSRIFFQGYLRYHGDFRTEPLNFPVSMDANVAPTFWQTMKNLYKQLRRWGWGVENIPYMLDGFRKDPQIPLRKKWYWAFNELEGFHSWATNSLMIFALGWLPVFLGGRNFNYSLLSYNLPQITKFIIELSMIGVASSAIISILLLPPRPQWVSRSSYIFYFLQWLLLPVTLIFFGAIPGLEAQTRLMLGGKFRLGFWVTPKIREGGRGNGSFPEAEPTNRWVRGSE